MRVHAFLALRPAHTIPVCSEAGKNCFIVCVLRAGPRQNDKVDSGQVLPGQSKTFPNQSFKTISLIRMPDPAFGNRQAQPGMLEPIFAEQHGEISIARRPSIAEYLLECSLVEQPLFAGEMPGRRRVIFQREWPERSLDLCAEKARA